MGLLGILPFKPRRSIKKAFKIKLKRTTVFSIASVTFLSLAGLILLSFLREGILLIKINNLLREYLGLGAFFLPFVFIITGLMFTRFKVAVNEPHVLIGVSLFLLSCLGILKMGIIGMGIWLGTVRLVTLPGAIIILFGGILIGLIVLFNTSIDQVVLTTINIFSRIKGYLFATKDKNVKVHFEEKRVLPLPEERINSRDPSPKPVAVKKEIPSGIDTLEAFPQTPGRVWQYPPVSILGESEGTKANRGNVNNNAAIIEKTLDSFGIAARVAEVNNGPAVTQYALEVALGTKLSKITSLSNDLALALAAPHGLIRIEAPIPGKSLVGIELPNHSAEFVTFRKMVESQVMKSSKSKLTVALGLDVSGKPIVGDIAKMPHVLIAGSTGSGKTVCLNTFVASLLFRASPNEVRLILVDPKRVELIQYNGVPHLLTPVIVEPEKVLSALKWAVSEMERRYKLFAEVGVRNVDAYNELSGFSLLPYIVIIVDELADIMLFAPVEVEDAICRIAQMARATGIHLVIATQRPSVDVLTGLIKANFPSRISFAVSSMIDSRVIIDQPGAEKLLGRGDMLYIPSDQAKPTRIQGAYLSDKDILSLIDFLKRQAAPVYTDEVTAMPVKSSSHSGTSGGADDKDHLFEEAVKTVCQYDRASASLLQRRLSIGYARAARIIDQLEAAGIVGPGEGSKPREVLTRNPEEFLASNQTPS